MKLILLLSIGLAHSLLIAQTDATDHPVAHAERLMNESKPGAAVELLEAYLKSHQNDATGYRLLGRALYWLNRFEASRSRYEEALRLEPDNHALRLEYARTLVESYALQRARVVVTPLRTRPETAAEAEALLGTMEYWEGDWTAASMHFRTALQHNARHAEARRHWNEIRMTTAPSVSVTSEYGSDTQPLQRLTFGAEGAWNFTPLQALTARAHHQRGSLNDGSKQIAVIELGIRQFLPSLLLETDAGFGVVRRSFADRIEGTWRAGFGLRLPIFVVLRIRGERAPYLHTSSSYSTPLMTTTIGAGVDWSPPAGWAGQASYDVVHFPDANVLQRVSLWFLAPLARSGPMDLSAGYGFNFQDTRENRYQLDPSSANPSGMYEPYYTPLNLRSHNLLAALKWRSCGSLTIRVSGGFGFSATETPPSSTATGPSTTASPRSPGARSETTTTRSFSPWNLEAAMGGPLGSALSWSLEGKYWSTAFYDMRQVRLRLSYRLLPAELSMELPDVR